jgi:hypothetical protein
MLYDYKCECGLTQEIIRPVAYRDAPIICKCGKEMVRIIGKNAIFTFEPYLDKNIDPDRPILISSKNQLYEETKKRGLTSKYCAESFNNKKLA